MDWFTSDWHLGHKNIIRFDGRPFSSIEEHDKAIIKNTMSVLKPGDRFFYLGDFALTGPGPMRGYLETLKSSGAELYFIKGNHDKNDTIKLYKQYGTFLGQQENVNCGEQHIVLNHFKLCIWDRCHHGSWHLYGHSHGRAEHFQIGKSFDVAINAHGYQLWSIDEVSEKMKTLQFKLIDHHGKEEKIRSI